ncbi:hypothetical protein Tco_1027685, partial [Tanacetum coccineum]
MAPGRRPIVRRNPPVNRSTNRNNVDINSGIDIQAEPSCYSLSDYSSFYRDLQHS